MSLFTRPLLVALLVGACAGPTEPRGDLRLEVSERIGPCLGSYRAGCVNVRAVPDGEWHPAELYGFNYQEGHRYLIDADLSSAAPQSPHLVNAVYTVRRVVSRVSVPPA